MQTRRSDISRGRHCLIRTVAYCARYQSLFTTHCGQNPARPLVFNGMVNIWRVSNPSIGHAGGVTQVTFSKLLQLEYHGLPNYGGRLRDSPVYSVSPTRTYVMRIALLATLLLSAAAATAQVTPNAPGSLNIEGGSQYTPPTGSGRRVGDEWFVENMTPPNFGWTGRNRSAGADSTDVVVTSQSSGGPQGRPFIRQTISSSLAEFGDEFYFERLPSTASRVFVRFSWRQNTENQLQKLLIVNPGGGSNDGRSILQNYGWDGGMAMRVAIDGGLQCQTNGAPVNRWQNYQLEISYRGTWTGYKLWRDSNDYNNPTCQWQGSVTPLTASNWVTFSGYHQGNVAGGGTRIVDHADVRIGPTFDPNWHQ